MKRLTLSLLALLCLTPLAVAQIDQTLELTVSRDNRMGKCTFNDGTTGASTVGVNITDEDDEGFWLEIQITNDDPVTYLPFMLFDYGYNNKELKKQTPKIELIGNLFEEFNKNSSSTVLPATVTHADGETEMALEKGEPLLLESEASGELQRLHMAFGETASMQLPVYIVSEKEYKDKKKGTFKKLKINQLCIFNLLITAQGKRVPKADEQLTALREEFDQLSSDVQEQKFCTSKKHKPNLSGQKKEYTDQLTEMRKRATVLMQQQSPSSPGWDECNDLLAEIGDLEKTIGSKKLHHVCESCNSGHSSSSNGNNQSSQSNSGNSGSKPAKKHSCDYCNTDAAKRMNQIATEVTRNGKATSSQLSEAKGLYNCASARKALTGTIKRDYATITSKNSGKKDDSSSSSNASNKSKHSCNYCNVNVAKRMNQLATEVKRSGKATAKQLSEAKALYNCASARGALSSTIKRDYATITSK